MEERRKELQRLLDEGNATEAVRVLRDILAKGWVVEGRVSGIADRPIRTEIPLPTPPASFSYTTLPFQGYVSPIPRNLGVGSRYPSGIGSVNPSFPASEEQISSSSLRISIPEPDEDTVSMHH